MRQKVTKSDLLAGIQWFLFMFANIVVIPIAIGAAYELQQDEIVSLLQLSFIVTGLACLAQVTLGHHRPIMEGQSGLWWGIFFNTRRYDICSRNAVTRLRWEPCTRRYFIWNFNRPNRHNRTWYRVR